MASVDESELVDDSLPEAEPDALPDPLNEPDVVDVGLESLDVLLLAMESLEERPVGERLSSAPEEVAPEFIAPVLEFAVEPVELLAIVLEALLLSVAPAVLVARSVSDVELVALSDAVLAPRNPKDPAVEPETLVVSELATFVLLVLEMLVLFVVSELLIDALWFCAAVSAVAELLVESAVTTTGEVADVVVAVLAVVS